MKTKILEQIKKIWNNPDFQKKFKTWLWTTANGFIVLMVGMFTTIQPDVVDPKVVLAISGAIALLNGATKYINKNYL